MEFFLVPLLAIVLVTFVIYKLTALLFHIHLSGSLLILLVLFAWLISFVMPGLFFPATGFLGSVGVSLVSAVGFAWLATTYEARHQGRQQNPATTTTEDFVDDAPWTPPAEAAFPMQAAETGRGRLADELVSKAELPDQGPSAVNFAAVADAFIFDEPDEPEEPSVEKVDILPEEVEMSELREPIERVDIPAPSSEEEAASSGASIELEDPGGKGPASDTLEDLLEFAFQQRSCNNGNGALETFRLILSLYGDGQTLPLVVAEIVSVLQSAGLYDEAVAELSATLQLPGIVNDPRLVEVFEQKLAYLLVLRELLQAQGMPSLPFEKVPAEWGAWVEQKVLAGNRVQS